ncbi:ATP-dependent nuclease [Spirosoma pollinicola]|uniref:AAA+ ATPase domain-containing protein n=1 Tax=Spirosoma pollinicola TaxID=2057025 RepID=A0A2K8YTK8_9BACT|nr:ATP-binding protein [Spirosoma pollinicola]AUD00966.1 hypothetical protein CWM47_03515 [Spirosoma pollinicola]
MRLILEQKFKSFNSFAIELPNLVILTGLNGAGKTQLLNSIEQEISTVYDDDGIEINPKKFVTSQSLAPNSNRITTKEAARQIVVEYWQRFNQVKKYFTDDGFMAPPHLDRMLSDEDKKTARKISILAQKNIIDLTIDDYLFHIPLDAGIKGTDIFHQSFSLLFKSYQDKLDENRYRKFLKENNQIDNYPYLEEEDFIAIYGEAPWDFANKIISEARLDYRISTPSVYRRDDVFEIKLTNNLTKAEVEFSELSSGEKILMSLALAQYNSEFDLTFPKLLLMDEPDASLHPAMSKQFIDVIQNVFLAAKGVKVILTTHSPSTVAFAPEESIFIVNKTGERVQKVTKDKALKILTSGVPSFSINYENRRQVFVESPNDVLYYENLYQKLSYLLMPEVSLSFISSGDSRTDKNGTKVPNCDQVKNITTILRKFGNNFVWGIIDYDSTNKSNDFIKVLGDGNRYSIESYLLDPILVGALLLRSKLIDRSDLGLQNDQNHTDFKTLPVGRLQAISDFIVDKVQSVASAQAGEKKTVQLINNLQIEIPIWYLQFQGHDLEELIIKAFPKLHEIKRGKEEALKLEIINKIIDEIPMLVSVDILDAFKSVQDIG